MNNEDLIYRFVKDGVIDEILNELLGIGMYDKKVEDETERETVIRKHIKTFLEAEKLN